jgi:hypothetical protein
MEQAEVTNKFEIQEAGSDTKVILPKDDPDNIGHAMHDGKILSVMPDGEQTVKFRCGIKKNLMTGETTHIRWLVGELNGVKVYVNGDNIIMTTRELHP